MEDDEDDTKDMGDEKKQEETNAGVSCERPGVLTSLERLEHSSECREPRCRVRGCHATKRKVQHARQCRGGQGCGVCQHLLSLARLHASHCTKPKCQVTFCSKAKHGVKAEKKMWLM